MAIADFVQSTAGLVTLAVIVSLAIAFAVTINTRKGRRWWHGVLLKTPLINKVIVYSSTERFARVLGVLLDSGVPLSDALPSASDCSNNLVFKGRLDEATQLIMQGDGFAEPMADADIFPNTMLQMIKVGEETGELAAQLDNVAGFFNDELDYAVDKMTEWFEPIMIIFIGVVVGFVALAMVSAMYGIYGQVEL